MRVAILSTFHERCGIATHSEGLAEGLVACGAHVDVLAPRLRQRDEAWGDQPPRLWNRNRAFGFEAIGIMRAIHALRPDIVHAQVNLSLFSSRVLFNIGYLLHRAGIPFVATLHGRRGGSWGRNFKLWRFALALRHADLIVHSEEHRRELSRERVHIISPGLPRRMPRSKSAARSATGLAPGRPVLAHFGFLVPDKGVAEVVRAVADLARSRIPDIYYWICGAVFDSNESRQHFADLQRLIAELRLESHVHVTGEFLPEEDAIRELEAADWIVLNYRTGNSQGASGAVRRALSSGRPVAVSDVPVFDDVRVATRTIAGPLADALGDLLADRAAADHYAELGRRFCDEQSWERVAARHLALYESILARRSSAGGVPKVIADSADRKHQR